MSLKMPDCGNFSTCCHADIIRRIARWKEAFTRVGIQKSLHTHAAASGEIYRWYVRQISNQFNGVEQEDLNAGAKGATVSPRC